MKKYLIDKVFGVRCKNKLQIEINNVAEAYHRVVVNEDEFQDTYMVISNIVGELNINNPRCKAEIVDFYKHTGTGDRSITVGDFVRLCFLQFEEI